MSRVILTTTCRRVSPDQPSGYIYVVDLSAGRVLRRSEIIEAPWRDRDPNPRGGLRGAKGMAVRSDQIAIANPSMIFRYDADWRYLGLISHPSCAAIHDIAFDGETIWVSSARNDILFQFHLDGRLLRHHDMRRAVSGISELAWGAAPQLTRQQIRAGGLDFRDPSSHRQLDYDRAHVNSVCALPDGSILASLGQLISQRYAFWLRVKTQLVKLGLWGRVVKINKGIQSALRLDEDLHSDLVMRPGASSAVVLRFSPSGNPELCIRVPDVTAPCHSLLPLPDETALYLNTATGSVIHFDPWQAEIISSTRVTDGFLRGAAQIKDDSILIGSNTTLLLFDHYLRQVKSELRFSTHPHEAVFDIQRLPPHFPLPPTSFEVHLTAETGRIPEDLLSESSGNHAYTLSPPEGAEKGM